METPTAKFLEAASSIGARLCRDALWDGNRSNWMGASMEIINNSWTVVRRAYGPDMYSGTSGVALFLARLFGLTGERLFRIVAEGGIRQAISRIGDVSPATRVGFYSGLTGIAYALADLGEILQKEEFIIDGLHALKSLSEDDPNTQGLDVIEGSGGAIPALLDLWCRYHEDFILELAIQHGDHLINAASKDDVIGWSWNTVSVPSLHNLTGFAHGTAGIAWALLELYRATQLERFLVASEGAMRYERHWFSAEHENWPDFRNLSNPGRREREIGTPSYMVAWCHGAPGIGLSRLRAFKITGDAICRSEAEAALRTTAKVLSPPFTTTYQMNYSLCHGLAGNADLFIYAHQVLAKIEYRESADQVGEYGIEQYLKRDIPWPCGVLGAGETPNMMLGLAGIGHFYLRLHDPAKVPSVLIVLPRENTRKL